MAHACEFPLRQGLIYLNHAAVGVWPRRTYDAVVGFARENMLQGATDYPRWLQVEHRLRQRLQWLVGASSADDIALVKNTSEGLSLVAWGLNWHAGDNVVISDQEFPSNRIVWESLATQGVELRQVPVAVADPEAALLACCDERTRLLSISSVQYATGLRHDLARLGAALKEREILFCIDAIQSLGALGFDALACHADIVVADAHKWMLGPEGVAVFYTRPEVRQRLRLLQFGWHMVEHAGDFDRLEWQPARSARRFEPGSPNMLGIHALDASLSLFQELGMEHVQRNVLAKSARLASRIEGQAELELLSNMERTRSSGIVTFRVRGMNAGGHARLHRQLHRAGVVCAVRGGGLRFSPHFYTSDEDLDRAVELTLDLIAG